MFQSFNLFPHLSVIDNILLGPVHAMKRPREEVRVEALELLARIGLAERAEDYPDRLSGGQQQRVAIVRSLAMQPALLLLDEVTSALDPTLVGEVLDLLRDLAASGTTMLIATHEMNFARDVAHQVAYLDQGVLVESGHARTGFRQRRSTNRRARSSAGSVRSSRARELGHLAKARSNSSWSRSQVRCDRTCSRRSHTSSSTSSLGENSPSSTDIR